MNSRSSATALACLIALAANSAAMAQGSEREWRAACTRDAFVHCTHQALAGDRSGVRDCLVQKLDKISTACRTVIRTAMATQTRAPVPATVPSATER
jgi:hypothetical protein